MPCKKRVQRFTPRKTQTRRMERGLPQPAIGDVLKCVCPVDRWEITNLHPPRLYHRDRHCTHPNSTRLPIAHWSSKPCRPTRLPSSSARNPPLTLRAAGRHASAFSGQGRGRARPAGRPLRQGQSTLANPRRPRDLGCLPWPAQLRVSRFVYEELSVPTGTTSPFMPTAQWNW